MKTIEFLVTVFFLMLNSSFFLLFAFTFDPDKALMHSFVMGINLSASILHIINLKRQTKQP